MSPIDDKKANDTPTPPGGYRASQTSGTRGRGHKAETRGGRVVQMSSAHCRPSGDGGDCWATALTGVLNEYNDVSPGLATLDHGAIHGRPAPAGRYAHQRPRTTDANTRPTSENRGDNNSHDSYCKYHRYYNRESMPFFAQISEYNRESMQKLLVLPSIA